MAKTLARRRRALPGAVVVPWRKVAVVVALTDEVLALEQRASLGVSKALVAIGNRLRRIKGALDHGQWVAWVEEAVPFGIRQAQNYLSLAIWAEREPREVARYEHLGPSKLVRLAALPPDRRRRFKPRAPIPIPGGTPKLLEVMTVAELDRAIGGFATPPAPSTPIAKLVQAYRFRLASLTALNTELVARSRELDRTALGELIAELHGLTQDLEAIRR